MDENAAEMESLSPAGTHPRGVNRPSRTTTPGGTPMGTRIGTRIGTIDGARGVAMMLVFVAHFCDAYFGLSSPVRHGLLSFVTRVASPAFVWISGIMLGTL